MLVGTVKHALIPRLRITVQDDNFSFRIRLRKLSTEESRRNIAGRLVMAEYLVPVCAGQRCLSSVLCCECSAPLGSVGCPVRLRSVHVIAVVEAELPECSAHACGEGS